MDIRKWFKKEEGKSKTSKKPKDVKAEVEAEVKSASSPILKKPTHGKKEPEDSKPKQPPKRASRNKRRIVEDEDDEDDKMEEKTVQKVAEVMEDDDSDEYEVVCDMVDEDDGDFNELVDEDDEDLPPSKRKRKGVKTASKNEGKGRGKGKGAPAVKVEKPAETSKPKAQEATKKPSGGGRGGWGRGAFMGERAPPPHKGEKEVPRGPEDALSGLTFVISGTLDSLEREEAEDLIKSHGGRITSAVSRKTSFLLADEDVGGAKSKKAKEIGVPTISEDKLFEMIRAKIPVEKKVQKEPKNISPPLSQPKKTVQVPETSKVKKQISAPKRQGAPETVAWPQKYAPKSTRDIVGNSGLVKQLHDWLASWPENNQKAMANSKGKKSTSSGGFKKAVLISGTPGIGKTTTARVVCGELGLQVFEVNASDTRGKSDSKLQNGIAGKTANLIKEMVSNEALSLAGERGQSVLVMDEVDGMSGGDRGGVADLIASIKVSRVPIICICNDRYARQLQSLTNHCLLLNYRKPTKQQMAKRLREIADKEKIQIADNVLEELSERVNGDMRMALNQLQYMSLLSRQLSFADMKTRLQHSAKDEDLKPMAALDRLLGFTYERIRFDERIDAALSDIDLLPLMIQENYLNYKPNVGNDPSGALTLDRAVEAADAISEADRVNVSIRRFQNWQLLPFSGVMSAVYPGALVHGQRQVFNQGEMNFNRFPGWLGKNSTAGKNWRLLNDLHTHMLASRVAEPTRMDVRLDYLHLLADKITSPLKNLPKEEGVPQVLGLLEEYSLTLEDYDTILTLLKFKGFPDLTQGIPSTVKGQLTRDFKKLNHKVKSADLLPEIGGRGPAKKKLTKRVAAIIEPTSMADADVPVAVDDVVKEEDEEEDEEDDDGVPSLPTKTTPGRGAGRGSRGGRSTTARGRGRGRGRK